MSKQPEMKYRRLGRAGVKLSALGLGGWTTYGATVTDDKLVSKIIRRAFEAGVNFFDIADIYAKGNAELAMARVLSELPRHRLVISSKVYWPMSDDPNDRGLSRKHILESIDKSLKRLETDYLDLYFCHRPDPETPVEETVRAMDHLVQNGKILYWGTSEWSGEQLEEAWQIADRGGFYGPQVEQPQFNLLTRTRVETDVRPAAEKRGMGLVTWSPLALGVLTGKYLDDKPAGARLSADSWSEELEKLMSPENTLRIRKLGELANEQRVSSAQLALAWTLAQPGVTSVITGATRCEQLEENLGSLELDEDLTRELNEVFQPN